MAKVKFGDVVKEVKNKVDRNNNPYEFYVAGDHMDTDSLSIPRRGSFLTDDVGPAFIREFKKGQVLYGSRRTYLRKVAVADFDGVTANTTFVLETKDENVLRQRLLPFIMYTDGFTEWSIKKSKGSTNPYVLFKDLADYEFDLPSIEEQDKLVDVLWSINDTLQAYQNLLTQTDALVQAQFVEMFGDPIKNQFGMETKTIGEITESILSGQCLNGDERLLSPGQKAVLKVSAVTYGYFKADEYKVLRDCNQITKGLYPQAGDLLFSRANTKEYVGATALVTKDYPDLMLPDKLWKLVFKRSINTVYMKYFLSHPSTREVLSNMATGTSGSMYNISMQKLRTLKVIVPSSEQQNLFAQIATQAEQSKSTLQKTITSLQATKRCILETALGNRGKE